MDSLVERMARRVKEHPYAVVLSFIATVALPISTIAFSLIPFPIALIVSGVIAVGIIGFLALEPDGTTLPQPPVHVSKHPSGRTP